MKPLTIEELRNLEVGDWVWIVIDNEEELCCHTSYYKLDKKIHYDIGIDTLSFTGVEEDPELALSIYGTKWLAYKNKEMAESKGEIVELPCKVGDTVYIIDNDRHWAQIDMMRIYNEHNGSKKIVFEWVQLDVGVDVTEVWDDGEFDMEEIGKTVLLEKVHEERIQQLIREENLRYAQWEEEAEAERRLAELRGEK